MLLWITENLGTIAVGLMLLAVLVGIAARLIVNHRKGKSSCGSCCSACPMGDVCHQLREY